MKITYILAAAVVAFLASCSQNQGWSVSGTIANAPEGSKVAVEGFNAGRWYNIDSVAVAPDGAFSYISPEGAPYPDVYRLSLDGRSIYFPVDSLDHLTVKADAADFDTDFQVTGAPGAETITNIDKKIAATVGQKGVAVALTDSVLKAELNQAILDDSTGVVAFYILNKSLGGKPLYTAANRRDVAMLGATAQKFADLRPADPRTKVLEQQFVEARKAHSGPTHIVEAESTGLVAITLYDDKGAERSLEAEAAKNKLTLLSFSNYVIEQSLPYNVILNKVYEKYHNNGLDIYQVAFDTDELAWRETATNLPWITVFCSADNSAPLLGSYNVTSMPLTYIINGQGDVVKRVDNPADLEKEVAKYM